MDYPGGFITKTAPTLNPALGNAAPGVWRLNDVLKNIKAGTWPAIDPYFDYTTLLLHGNGTNGGQNNTFQDSSTNNFTITRNGNTTQGTFSPFSQTGWSNYFDGSGDYLQAGTSSNLALGSGDFTVEGWHFCTGYNGGGALYSTINTYPSSTGFLFYIYSDGSYTIDVNGTILKTTAVAALNTWVHYAVVRSGSTITIYANGTSVGTVSNSTNFTDQYAVIGRTGAGASSNPYLGYLSNCRTVKGTAVYTAAFTPPTAPLTAITNTQFLTCQSNRFIDNSANQFTITRYGDTSVQAFSPFAPTAAYSASTVGGSGYFDGSGDYLTFNPLTAINIGTSDFTIEAWVYHTGGVDDTIYSDSGSFTFVYGATGYLRFYLGAGSNIVDSSIPFVDGQWAHVCVSRSSATLRMFINGAVVATSASYPSIGNSSSTTYIGRYYGGTTQDWQGYISNLRVVVGTAVYTGNFTPPTAPLTNITNTSLLLNFTNAAIIDNTAKNVLETVGNAQISTTQSKFGGASISFASSGDGLNSRDSDLFDMSSGDFTVEMWARANNLSGEQFLMGQNNSSTYYAPFRLGFDGTKLIAFMSTSGSSWGLRLEAGSALSNNTWYHIALVRYGTSFKLYVNGNQYDSGTLSGALYNSSDIMRIGWAAISLGNFTFNGYLDDIRITKGIARYTSNFTPQTSQWQDQ